MSEKSENRCPKCGDGKWGKDSLCQKCAEDLDEYSRDHDGTWDPAEPIR